MKYALEINENVEIDINEAREYYEQRDTGLGRRFAEFTRLTSVSLRSSTLADIRCSGNSEYDG